MTMAAGGRQQAWLANEQLIYNRVCSSSSALFYFCFFALLGALPAPSLGRDRSALLCASWRTRSSS
jgi:hypothetical protein